MCISQHDCAAKGGKVVTIPRAPRTTRAVDLATGPIPVGGFCRNDEGSRTVAMMAHRPVVGGRGRGEQKGQSRGVSWRFLMARPRSRLPGQARLVTPTYDASGPVAVQALPVSSDEDQPVGSRPDGAACSWDVRP